MRTPSPTTSTGNRPNRSDATPAGIAIVIFAKLASAQSNGTQVNSNPASPAHSTTNTSGTAANDKIATARINVRSRESSNAHLSGAAGVRSSGASRARPSVNITITMAPGTTDQ